MADLEEILHAGGYVCKLDLQDSSSFTSSPPPSDQNNIKLKRSDSAGGGGVAMPQSSVLSYCDLTIGSVVASGMVGMILSITILPNLWLVGILLGSLYGYQVSRNYKDKMAQQPTGMTTTPTATTNVISHIIIDMEQHLAKAYLVIYDFFHGIWFMYKTGQLG